MRAGHSPYGDSVSLPSDAKLPPHVAPDSLLRLRPSRDLDKIVAGRAWVRYFVTSFMTT